MDLAGRIFERLVECAALSLRPVFVGTVIAVRLARVVLRRMKRA